MKNYLVFREEPVSAAGILHRQQHNEREAEVYANGNIDLARKNENIYFKKPTGDYMEMVQERIDAGELSIKGLKADAGIFSEIVIGVNTDFWVNKDETFRREFFEAVYEWLKNKFGEENIISCVWHRDEIFEWTLDSNKIFLDKEEGYNPTDEELADATLSFEEVFGINYKDYDNVYDLACDIAKTQGADPNLFVGSRINEGMYDSLYDEDNRRKYFYYENEEFDPQIPDDAEIISKDFRVIINTDNFGKDYISNIDIVINYKKDDKVIEKIWETRMSILG